jgi:hypothetical protein
MVKTANGWAANKVKAPVVDDDDLIDDDIDDDKKRKANKARKGKKHTPVPTAAPSVNPFDIGLVQLIHSTTEKKEETIEKQFKEKALENKAKAIERKFKELTQMHQVGGGAPQIDPTMHVVAAPEAPAIKIPAAYRLVAPTPVPAASCVDSFENPLVFQTKMPCTELSSFLGCQYDIQKEWNLFVDHATSSNHKKVPKGTFLNTVCPCACGGIVMKKFLRSAKLATKLQAS